MKAKEKNKGKVNKHTLNPKTQIYKNPSIFLYIVVSLQGAALSVLPWCG